MDEQLKSLIEAPLANDDPIDFKEYWRIVDRFKWRIVLFSVAVTILAIVYSLSLIPQYSATVKLMIESDKANLVSVKEIYGLDSNRRDYYMTQFEILKSEQLIRKVIEKLKLLDTIDFKHFKEQALAGKQSSLKDSLNFLGSVSSEGYGNDASSDETAERIMMQTAVEAFLLKLTFKPIRHTKLVNITYDSADPKLAAKVANGLAEMYIESYLESNLEKTNTATEWMNEKISSIEEQLKIAENKLQAFLEREKLVDDRGISSQVKKKLDDLTDRHILASRLVTETKNIYDLSRREGITLVEMAAIPAVLNNSIIQDARGSVITEEQNVSSLSKRYGPKHPTMIAAQTKLSSATESFDSQLNKLILSIATEYQSARTNERQLAKQVADATKEYQRLSIFEREFTNLQSEVDIKRQLYNSLSKRLNETSATSGFQTANARILDRAQIPLYPSKPSKKKIVGLAMIGAFMFAVALAFLHDFLSAGIRSIDDIERRLRQRMLGIIPLQKMTKGSELPNDIFFDKDNRGFSEAIRTIRTSLLMSQMGTEQKIIAITSSIPNEGKSTLATNLAFALGQMEKVLLIDADLRRPSLGRRFGYPPYHAGLSNLIAQSASLSSCVVTDQKSNVDLMLAGAIPPNPQELLSSDLMKTALKLMSAKYDRIIIDTAPTQAVGDSLVISTHADSMIYVVKADSTHFKNIKAGLGRLLQIGANIAGVVLNQVDLDESSKYGDYDGYYDHYGYQVDEEAFLKSSEQGKQSSNDDEEKLVAPPKFT